MDEPTTDAERYEMARRSGMSPKGAQRYVEQKHSGDEPHEWCSKCGSKDIAHASDEPRYVPEKTRDEIDAANAAAARRYVEKQTASDEPRGTDKTGGGETLNGQILRAMCAIDGLPPILAAVFAEVALLKGSRVDGGAYTQMVRDANGIWRLTVDASGGPEAAAWKHAIALCVLRALRLSKEGAHG